MQYRNTTIYRYTAHHYLHHYLIPILTPSSPPPPSLLAALSIPFGLFMASCLLGLVDGLEHVQCLVQQEGSVVNQHVQVEVEGRVLSLISGGKGREGKGREG